MRPLYVPADEFAAFADRVVAAATDFLATLDDRRTSPATSAADTTAAFDKPLPERGVGDAVLEDLDALAAHARASTGRLFPYVVGSGESIGALGDLYASVLNQNVTAWRSAPAAVTVERTVVRWLAEAIGCTGFTGSLTSGGSLANLMALAMARESRAPANDDGATPCVVYASTEVHMAIPKAVALLGIGRANLRLIPVDDDFRIDVKALEAAIADDQRAGLRGIAVVASAGTISARSIRCRNWQNSPERTTFGFTSTARTARLQRSRSRRSLPACRSPTRSCSTRTSGFTSRSTAASSFTGTRS